MNTEYLKILKNAVIATRNIYSKRIMSGMGKTCNHCQAKNHSEKACLKKKRETNKPNDTHKKNKNKKQSKN